MPNVWSVNDATHTITNNVKSQRDAMIRDTQKTIGARMKIALVISVMLMLSPAVTAQKTRTFRPDDMFQLRRIGATTWSPDGQYVTIEFSKPHRYIEVVPEWDLFVLDVKTRALRPLSPRSSAYIGFFNAVWSRYGRRVAFLSIDRNAVVRAWVWTVGTAAASPVPNVEPRVAQGGDTPLAWIDGDRLAVMSWEPGAPRGGGLQTRILHGRNIATKWQQAFEGKTATVSTLDSRGDPAPDAPAVELVSVDLRNGARKQLARGRMHVLRVEGDGCCVSVLRLNPGVPGQPVTTYFKVAEQDVDDAYQAVNWGTERHFIDARTGATVDKPAATPRPPAPTRPKVATLPDPDAQLLSFSRTGDAALYLANGPTGSQLWLAGGAGRPIASFHKLWQANEWMRDVKLGRAESFTYKAKDGSSQIAWLLLPPDHVAGTRVPVITIVYPGDVYDSTQPRSFSAYLRNFDHPQLFAALGYAVLLPSMPAPKDPAESHSLSQLPNGVIPAIDAAIANGHADPDRIAVLGHSGGGFAVLGLITQTNRFRSAIASAGYTNFQSLYGTFYGQFRHGDAGRPDAAQVLRMLQLEKGFMGLGGPPWKEAERYRENSSINFAHKVETPLLLVQGELDYIPIQQSEEFFTALLRQDKRVRLLRYAGEMHVIADRVNILHLWEQMEQWLKETMSPAKKER